MKLIRFLRPFITTRTLVDSTGCTPDCWRTGGVKSASFVGRQRVFPKDLVALAQAGNVFDVNVLVDGVVPLDGAVEGVDYEFVSLLKPGVSANRRPVGSSIN